MESDEQAIHDAIKLLPVLQARLTETVLSVNRLAKALPAFKEMVAIARRYRPDLLPEESTACLLELVDLLLDADQRIEALNDRIGAIYAARAAEA